MSAVADVRGDNWNKTRPPDGCVAIPELQRAKNELLLGIRLDLDLGCGLDVDRKV